jgi:cellulose synthase/poly-beta-1,6-N-acetylglucosamine synthase-like glycosyltransferase
VFKKENGGKSAALNFALMQTSAEVVVAIDADTVLAADAVKLLVRHFDDPSVGAVAGTATVGNQITLMARFQALEYVISQNLDRRAMEQANAIGVVPGAIGAWRRDALMQVGGYSHDTLAEDADVTISIERRGWQVLYEPRALALTEAPETVRAFLKQRFRWMFGTLQVAFKHAGALLSSRPTGVGLVTIPNIVVFQFAFTLLAPLMDLVLIVILLVGFREWMATGGFDVPENLEIVARYWVLFQTMDLLSAAAGIRLGADGRCWRLLPLILLQRFCYRQLLYFVAIRTLLAAIKGQFVGWGKLLRTGNVAAPAVASS